MSWPDLALGVVCDVRRGTTITQTQTREGRIPVVAGGLNATYCHDTPNRPGNVITISASGANAGFVNFWSSPIFASDCSTVESDGKKVDVKFVYHFLRSKQEYINSKLRSGAAQPHVYAKDIAQLLLPLPPLPEQRRIAAILDQTDALRAKRREALAQLDSLTQAIFIEMFGDPATNSKLWGTSSIEQLAEQVTDGEHLTPKREPQGIKLLSARNVRDGFIDFGNVDYIGIAEHERIKRRCNPVRGDLLISCSGSIGRVASVETDEPFSLVRSVAIIRPKKDLILTKYLEHYLRTPAMNAYMIRRANASSQANLFQGPIREMPVMVPTYSLQQTFATRVKSVGALKSSYRAALRELDTLFASLQHRAFRGDL